MDSVAGGIGLSQVARYVERLARHGVDVTLHSFEPRPPDDAQRTRLYDAGVKWRPHPFGDPGVRGGVVRVAKGAVLLAGAPLAHARTDLAAASAILARRRNWVWDMRGLWREQRTALGLLAEGSRAWRAMRSVERASANSSTAIVTLTHAAVDVLRERYGGEVASKCRVITTCVDLDLFSVSPMPPAPAVKLLLAGTLNRLYDVPTMLRLVDKLNAARPAHLTVLSAQPGPWDEGFRERGIRPTTASPAEMPSWVSRHHVGLSVLFDVGVSNRAATPTKLGEFLASGRPIVVNAGLGDMDSIVRDHDCGVVLDGDSEQALDKAVDEMNRLVDDPGTAERCRRTAERFFSIDTGIEQLLGAYALAIR
jgi:glycosyltransferase involved in cell wall biosynthesis